MEVTETAELAGLGRGLRFHCSCLVFRLPGSGYLDIKIWV